MIDDRYRLIVQIVARARDATQMYVADNKQMMPKRRIMTELSIVDRM